MLHVLAAHNARHFGQAKNEAAFAAGAVTVAGHAHHLFYGGDLLLIQGFRKSDGELQVQVALVEWVVLDGHALPIYALPAVRLDHLPWLRVDLRAAAPRGHVSATPTTQHQPLAGWERSPGRLQVWCLLIRTYGVAFMTVPAESQVSWGGVAYGRIVTHAAGLERDGNIAPWAQAGRS